MEISYVIIFVGDMSKSTAFYRDVVGFPLRFESPQWTEFDTGAATLALHQCESHDQAGDPRHDKAAGRCHPGFRTDSLDVFHARMLEHSVPCMQTPTRNFGVRIAQYRDPDGLLFSVSEGQPK